jgi:hypothetical protein
MIKFITTNNIGCNLNPSFLKLRSESSDDIVYCAWNNIKLNIPNTTAFAINIWHYIRRLYD